MNSDYLTTFICTLYFLKIMNEIKLKQYSKYWPSLNTGLEIINIVYMIPK